MMNWQERLMTLQRKTQTYVFRMVLCTLVFACSVAIVTVCVWNGLLEDPGSSLPTTFSPRPSGPILFSHTKSISIDEFGEADLDVSFYGNESCDGFLPQDQEEAISLAVAGRMCFPPVVSMALQQMLDEPVNDRQDTMLHVACRTHDVVTICFLIDAGADISVTNRFGETPLDLVDKSERAYVEGITQSIGTQRLQAPECSDSETHRG